MKWIYFLLLLWPVIAQAQPTPYEWQQQTGLAVMPPVAYAPSMTYDSLRDETLCVFPTGIDEFPGTWRWNGSAWTPPTDASSTERGSPVGIVFDSVRGVVVLFCRKGSYP